MATKEELFEAVKTLKDHCDKNNGCLHGPCPLFWWCKESSIADIQSKIKGTWLEPDDDYGYLTCSVCEERSPNDEEWNFCPNCGADMRK